MLQFSYKNIILIFCCINFYDIVSTQQEIIKENNIQNPCEEIERLKTTINILYKIISCQKALFAKRCKEFNEKIQQQQSNIQQMYQKKQEELDVLQEEYHLKDKELNEYKNRIQLITNDRINLAKEIIHDTYMYRKKIHPNNKDKDDFYIIKNNKKIEEELKILQKEYNLKEAELKNCKTQNICFIEEISTENICMLMQDIEQKKHNKKEENITNVYDIIDPYIKIEKLYIVINNLSKEMLSQEESLSTQYIEFDGTIQQQQFNIQQMYQKTQEELDILQKKHNKKEEEQNEYQLIMDVLYLISQGIDTLRIKNRIREYESEEYNSNMTKLEIYHKKEEELKILQKKYNNKIQELKNYEIQELEHYLTTQNISTDTIYSLEGDIERSHEYIDKNII